MDPRTVTDADKVQRRLGDRVAQARRHAGLTQKELGDRIGTSLGQVVKLEEGVVDPVPMLSRIAAAVGQPVESFAVPGLLTEALVQERSERPADLLASRISKLENEIRALTGQLADRDRALAELAATLERRSTGTAGATLAPYADGDASDDVRSILEESPGQPPTEELSEAAGVGGPEPAARISDDFASLPKATAPRASDHLLLRPSGATFEGGNAARVPALHQLRRRSRLLIWGAAAAGIGLGTLGFIMLEGHDTAPARTIAHPTAPQSTNYARAPVSPTPVVSTHGPRPPTTSAPIDVLVLNGNAVEGAAGREATVVRGVAGYRVWRVGNAPRQDYARSVVMYRPGFRKEALRLALKLKIGAVSSVRGLPLDVAGRAKLVVVTGLQQ